MNLKTPSLLDNILQGKTQQFKIQIFQKNMSRKASTGRLATYHCNYLYIYLNVHN